MNAPQGTSAWLHERTGFVTGSRFRDVLNFRKDGKPGADRQKYLMEVVCERMTGEPTEHFVTKAMQWGIDHEAEARAAFCAATGLGVTATGFLRHATLKAGCSPDGIIDMEAGLEIKCNTTPVFVDILLNGMGEEYMAQVQGGMWITGYSHWFFVAYDPRMPEGLRLHVQKIERDEKYIANLAEQVKAFSNEADEMIAKLMEKKHG